MKWFFTCFIVSYNIHGLGTLSFDIQEQQGKPVNVIICYFVEAQIWITSTLRRLGRSNLASE